MTETFISTIDVKKARNVTNIQIPLSPNQRKHLIITGKNGSGKTSLLLELNKFLTKVFNKDFDNYDAYKNQLLTLRKGYPSSSQRTQIERNIESYEQSIKQFGGLEIKFSSTDEITKKAANGLFLIAFFEAKRQSNLSVPSGIQKIGFKASYAPQDKVGSHFIQHIVNLKAERSFAKDDQDDEVVSKIDAWFERFEKRLQYIFGTPDLALIFDRKISPST